MRTLDGQANDDLVAGIDEFIDALAVVGKRRSKTPGKLLDAFKPGAPVFHGVVRVKLAVSGKVAFTPDDPACVSHELFVRQIGTPRNGDQSWVARSACDDSACLILSEQWRRVSWPFAGLHSARRNPPAENVDGEAEERADADSR